MLHKGNREITRALVLGAMLCAAPAYAQHPAPQPRPAASTQTLSADGMTTTVVTAPGFLPESSPYTEPPGANFLETVYSNMIDGLGVEIPNSLSSTPDNPYNLHPDPVVTEIDKTSPTDDLTSVYKDLRAAAEAGTPLDQGAIQFAIDIIEGNPIADRVYSGFPLLHYNGPEKVRQVEPIYDANGTVIGGNLNVHQIMYDSHYEADVAFVDPTAVRDVPWTITYTIDTLNRGHEDFAPFAMFTDDPAASEDGKGKPHFGIDQTFFPLEDGTRTVIEMKMPPAKYFKLTYHWGWRIHPPRVQVLENALQKINDKTLPQWEIDVFGEAPRSSEQAKLAAIRMIGNLAPAKRMWRALRQLKRIPGAAPGRARVLLDRIDRAFDQWKDRTALPDGVALDPDSDSTLFYVNNTIYGQMTGRRDDSEVHFAPWLTRGTQVKIKLYNGDYFDHAYVNVDFGGARGWENTFHSTLDVGGAGPFFSFGRGHWFPNAGAPSVGLIVVPPAKRTGGRSSQIGEHNVHITYNYDPRLRLRFYQFDPLHHDVAVWSVH